MKPLLIIFILLLFGCATSYKPIGIGGGYTDLQMDAETWKVSFRGNGYTSDERATDMALLRCADITLEHGFYFFSIIENKAAQEASAFTTPIIAQSGYYGNRAFTAFSGGSQQVIIRPTSTNTIIMLKAKPASPASMIYDAAFICKSFGDRYNGRCGLQN